MRTQKQVESWLRIRMKNVLSHIGGKTSYSKIGLQRVSTELRKVVDQLDEYIVQLKEVRK